MSEEKALIRKIIDWPGFPYYSWWQMILRLPFSIIHDIGLLITAFGKMVLDKGGGSAIGFLKEEWMTKL